MEIKDELGFTADHLNRPEMFEPEHAPDLIDAITLWWFYEQKEWLENRCP